MSSNTQGRSVPNGGSANKPSQNLPVTRPATAGPLTFQQLLKSYDKQIQAALPRHLTAERMMRVALTAFNQTPGLQECEPITLIAAIVQSSLLGLEPVGILGHSYLIPFKKWKEVSTITNKKPRVECQLIVGYKGYIELARRSGRVKTIGANLVRANDHFDLYYDPAPRLKHTPLLMHKNSDGVWVPAEQAEVVMGYGYASFLGGDEEPVVECMTIGQIEAIRDRFSESGSADDDNPDGRNVWASHYDTMCRKTLVKQTVRWLPLSPEIQTAVGLADRNQAGQSQDLVARPEISALLTPNSERGAVPPENTAGSGSVIIDGTVSDGAAAEGNGGAGNGGGTTAPSEDRQPHTQPGSGQQQPGGEATGLTMDDFDQNEWQELQANLKASGLNRVQILAWLGNFPGTSAQAITKSEQMRVEKEINSGGK